MPKNIVVCSDGTGNRGGKTRGTNVWRMFNAVDRHSSDVEQVTYYDDGVGTDDLRWARLLGGAFGYGLSRNIRRAYAFLAMNYEPGDSVFLLGFSRGAYTVRSLAGMVFSCGLPTRETLIRVGTKREAMLKQILRAYRSATKDGHQTRLRRARNLAGCDDDFRNVCIHFIGVWDTVDAVGMPFDGLKLLDALWRRVFKLRLWGFRDRVLDHRVKNAYQALALDDERKTFHPLIWECPSNATSPASSAASEAAEENQTVTTTDEVETNATATEQSTVDQVWFAGAHSNVGGGYPKDALSLVSLDWMMAKACNCGLRFHTSARDEIQRAADPFGKIYDSRTGLQGLYRYALRDPYRCRRSLPRVHGSVDSRIRRGTDYYAPKIIEPDNYTVVWTDDGPFSEGGIDLCKA